MDTKTPLTPEEGLKRALEISGLTYEEAVARGVKASGIFETEAGAAAAGWSRDRLATFAACGVSMAKMREYLIANKCFPPRPESTPSA